MEENQELWKKLPIGCSSKRWGLVEDNSQVPGTAILQAGEHKGSKSVGNEEKTSISFFVLSVSRKKRISLQVLPII